jgi:hypothetical protein
MIWEVQDPRWANSITVEANNFMGAYRRAMKEYNRTTGSQMQGLPVFAKDPRRLGMVLSQVARRVVVQEPVVQEPVEVKAKIKGKKQLRRARSRLLVNDNNTAR